MRLSTVKERPLGLVWTVTATVAAPIVNDCALPFTAALFVVAVACAVSEHWPTPTKFTTPLVTVQ